MTEKFPPPKYTENLNCPEAWGETVQTLHGPPGTIKLEFCVARWTQENPVYADRLVPSARVVMTVALAKILRDQLTERLAQLEKDSPPDQGPAASPTMN